MVESLKKVICKILAFTTVFSLATVTASASNPVVDFVDKHGYYTADDSILDLYLDELLNEDRAKYYEILNEVVSAHDDKSAFMTIGQYNALTYNPEVQSARLGIVVSKTENGALIKGVTSGSPAEQSGLMFHDVIVHINDKAVAPMTITEVREELLKDTMSDTEITVLRDGELITIMASRGDVPNTTVFGADLSEDIKYIQITSVAQNTTYDEFVPHWEDAILNDMSVILDLRGNPGGELETSADIINEMISEVNTEFMRVDAREASGGQEVYRTDGTGQEAKELVILVDRDSASAAEVISGAMQDLEYATLIGETTYGKGTGQYHVNVGGGMLILTVLKIDLPTSDFYDGVGINPDINVQNEEIAHWVSDFLDINTELSASNVSENVLALEKVLVDLSYLEKADKYYTADTAIAINKIQNAYGLYVTNVADTETLTLLNELLTRLSELRYLEDSQLLEAVKFIND